MCFKVKLILMHVSFFLDENKHQYFSVKARWGAARGNLPLIRHEVLYTDTQQERSGGFDNVAIPVRCWQEMKEPRQLSSSPPHTHTEHATSYRCTYAADIKGNKGRVLRGGQGT